ncbi:hypothetical protein [Nonomuraea sp. NPDC049784]|uniref:hypothetical protein n=1 Tax=Nonomuraea sp. NPDC049784 TaxID=3154361 RepID=UPI0033C9908E
MASGFPSEHTSVLNTLDPGDPVLDDLEPPRGVIEGARVVGVGEGAHFVDRIRSQGATVDTPLQQAFDAVVCTPTATADPTVDF